MHKYSILLLLSTLFILSGNAQEKVSTLYSGNLKVEVYKADNLYSLSFISGVDKFDTYKPDFPVSLIVTGKPVSSKYNSYVQNGESLQCLATIQTANGSIFSIKDLYIASGDGSLELQRELKVLKAIASDSYFNSIFGFQVSKGKLLTANEYFIPAVWYKDNFDPICKLTTSAPRATDSCFYYREDRITLPMVMFRDKTSGATVCIAHKDAVPNTVLSDSANYPVNEEYQFGSLGIFQSKNITYQAFLYPGTEAERRSGRGRRSHPVRVGITHNYNLKISFSSTTDYAEAVEKSWTETFSLLNPTVYKVDLQTCYNGLIATLNQYFAPSIAFGGIRDAPGFPFEVSLKTFQPMGIDYQMGFVGMQVATGYYLFREGFEQNNTTLQTKGEAVLNFWADKCLTSLGYPKSWYDPGLNGNTGSFRNYTNLRTCTGGMESLLTGWCFAQKNKISKPNWLASCKKFGTWLANNQNADGSWYFGYQHWTISGGKHPVADSSKYLTICAIRYLTELYIATGTETYRTAALKAGDFCLANINDQYRYIACVVDNNRTIDSESGQMALNGFLSLYDLTRNVKWLKAAEQAGIYTESWTYAYEIPVETDRITPTVFPKERSLIGQHFIAIGQTGLDMGNAWSAFGLYRLYLATGKEHFLHAARISMHNTHQSSNWDDTLFPGQARGLQLEAFTGGLPRRSKGVFTTLNWIYAAHLDPMFRFKDAFGTADMEEVERMTLEDKTKLIKRYSMVQSSDYGQEVIDDLKTPSTQSLKLYPNPIGKDEELNIEMSHSSSQNITLDLYNASGHLMHEDTLKANVLKYKTKFNVPSGVYMMQLKGKDIDSLHKIVIK